MTPRSRRVIPIIAPPILRRHDSYEATDGRFKAAARLMQSLWRERNGYAVGRRTDERGRGRRLGSLLSRKQAMCGANFVDEEVTGLVHRELAYREIAAVYDTRRLFGNLLASQALAFNLFGPMKLDLDLATAVFRRLAPDFVEEVTDIWFEHAPARGDKRFTGDHTAFDLLVCCHTASGASGFVAIEVKYTEAANAPLRNLSPRYRELARESGLFVDSEAPAIWSSGQQQLAREHLLSYAMLREGLFDEGRFMVVAPALNRDCQLAASRYASLLAANRSPACGFSGFTLESVIDAIEGAGATSRATWLRQRYLDFGSVDRALFTVIPGGAGSQKEAKCAAA